MTDTATQERTEEPQAEAQESAVEEPEPRGAEVAEQQAAAEAAVEPEVGKSAAAPEAEGLPGSPRDASRAGEAAEAETTSVREGPTEFEPRSIELLGNIEVEASAELGRAQLSIRQVLEALGGAQRGYPAHRLPRVRPARGRHRRHRYSRSGRATLGLQRELSPAIP